MPFDDLEQNQDEAATLPWRFSYPLPDDEDGQSKPSIGMRIMQMAPTHAPPDEPGPLRGTDVQLQQATQDGPKPGPRQSIGQRIMQIGNQGGPPFDIQGGRPVSRQNPQAMAKPSIGQRIMRSAWPGMPQSVPLSNTASAVNGVSVPPEQHGLFSSFIPAGTTATTSGPDDPKTPQRQAGGNEALGRSVGQAAGALTGAGLGAGQMLNSSTPVPDATNRVKAGSRIPRIPTPPDAKPNLALVNPQQQQTMKGLMAGIQDEGRAVDLENPLGLNIDPNLSGHMLPDNAGKELIELTKPEQWQKVGDSDKAKLAELMGHDMVAANDYAKAVLAGEPRPTAGGASRPFSREVDDLVHSSAWVDGRLKPEEKTKLAGLIRANDGEGADAFVRQLYRRFWYEGRYPRWANTTAGRLGQAGKIADAYEHNKQWIVETSKHFPKNTDKCNEFVADVMDEAGLEVPRIGGRLGRYNMGGPPSAAQWADRSKPRIGHWQIVEGPPQPGDVMAELTGGRDHPEWAHVGVVVGSGRTASANTLVYPKGMITVNDWGFRKDDMEKRVVRRYVP